MPRISLHNILHHSAFIPSCLLVVFTAIYFSSTVGVMNSGDAPSYALTQALVDEHTSQINNYPRWISPDYMVLNHNVYDFRPPGLSLLSIPSYVLAKTFQSRAREPYDGKHPGVDSTSRAEALTIMVPALCGALTVMLIYLLCLRFTRHTVASVSTAITVGLGSLLWKYSHDFIRVTPYTFLLTLALYLLVVHRPESRGGRWAVLTGAVLGYAVVTDTTAAFVVPVILLWFLYRLAKRDEDSVAPLSALASLAVGLSCAIAILAIFQLASFHRLISDTYQYSPHYQWMTPSGLFSTPLFPAVFVNLFNDGGLPLDSLSLLMRHNSVIFNQNSAYWALRSTYRGIFIQSPYLFPALLGSIAFARKYTVWCTLAFTAALAILISMSKYADFFNPNAFDTRLFLPMIPFLSIGLAFWWKAILNIDSRTVLKAILIGGTVFLTFRSIYNGWYSEITDYGPHVTGNTRFDLTQLQYPVLSGAHFFNDLGVLFVNTFPNIYNVWMLAVYADIVLLAYFGSMEVKSRLRRRREVSPPYVTSGAGEGANPK